MKFILLGRYYYLRFTRLKGNPRSLAMGTAIGVLIGISPTIPLHTILILAITMLTRTSAIAGIISSWVVCNPLTYIPIYYLSMVVGNCVTPYELSWQRVEILLDNVSSHQSFTDTLGAIASLGFEAIVVMIVGGFVLALPFTIASYYLSHNFFIKIKIKKERKRINRKSTNTSELENVKNLHERNT